MSSLTQVGDEKLFSTILRLHSKVLGLVLGLLIGTTIFLVTNLLVLKGGHVNADGEYVVGPHLELLSQFFIGYRVSFIGSLIGFAYGFAVGTLGGALIAWVYNKILDIRH